LLHIVSALLGNCLNRIETEPDILMSLIIFLYQTTV